MTEPIPFPETPESSPGTTPANQAAQERLAEIHAEAAARKKILLPAMVAIAFYLLVESGVVIAGVAGRHYPPLYLALAGAFLAGSLGMLRLLRWAWALALAAVFLLMIQYFWMYSAGHEPPALVQGLLNLVCFLYLVRPDVRQRLK